MNIPTLIANRYEVLEALGQGGFGSVFKVKDRETDDIVALKYLASNENDGLDVRRFQREFQHLSRLQHPHIVSVMDIGTDGDACYFTMEYLNGVTLQDALKSPDTGLYQVLQNGGDVFREILVQLCEALSCIHAQGLVHRDLKPANIFLQSDQNGPHVKILDLGLVKFRSDEPSPLTEEGTMLGTVHYMSPEQIRGVHVDHRADLYTLGIVLYEVLTGQKPFLGQNSAAVVLKHLNEVPVPPRVYNLDVPHDLQLVVLKLLEKEPERRYRLANDLLNDLVGAKSYAGRDFVTQEPPLLLQHPRFLGRSEEMAQAQKLLKDVQGGKGRALCISGPAGIGKTRFLEELKADAGLRGMQVMHGACYEDHTAPFQPIIECIRSVEKKMGGLNAWVRDEDKKELALLFQELGEAPQVLYRTAYQLLDLEGLFYALLQLLKDMGHRVPLMICIDDMQWVDQGTQEFIAFLCDRLDLLPFFLCLAQRPQKKDIESKWIAQTEVLVLDPLGPAGSRELLCSMFSTTDIPRDFCDDVCKLSGGNPFAVLEVAKALFSNKAIAWRKHKWIYSANEGRLPDEVSKVITLRFECLSDIEHQILGYASVINRPFGFDLVSDALNFDEQELFAQLELLTQYQFLAKDTQNHYSIFHNHIGQAVYQHLPLDEKEALHLKWAQVLSGSGQTAEVAGEIAHHFLQAGYDREALPFLVQAGDNASVSYAFRDAKKAYEKAHDIARNIYTINSTEYLDVICKYMDVLRGVRDWDNIKKHVWNIIDTPNIPPFYYGQLVSIISAPLMIDGNHKKAEKLILRAIQKITEYQYDKVRMHLCLNLCHIYWATGRYDEATHYIQMVVGICERSLESFDRTFSYFVLGHDHLTNSRFDGAEIAFQEALSEFEVIHKHKRYIQSCRAALREIYTYRGRFKDAEEISQSLMDHAQNMGIERVEICEKLDLGYIYFEQGKFSQAEKLYLQVVKSFKGLDDNHKMCLAYVRLSELYLILNDYENALQYALEAEKIVSPDLTRQSQVYKALGKVYAVLGELDQAEVYLKKSCTVLKQVEGFHFALALFESGTFYFDIGRRKFAEEQLGQALQMFKKMGADHFLKKAQKVWDHMVNANGMSSMPQESASVDVALNTKLLLDEAIDRLLQVTNADRGLILTVENGQPRLQTACSRHLDETSLNDISSTVIQAAIESGSLIVTSDASNDPRFEDCVSIADSNVGSILCMSLKARNGDVIGAVYADRAGDVDFSVEAVSFFKSFAAFVAVGLEHALRSEQLQTDLEKFAGMRTQLGDLVGVSQPMQQLYQTIEQVAHTDVPILLQGETGVGKGLVARTVHEKSTRANGPFLSVNCGALPRELLESELFGHKKGAFTGASEDRVGLFEAAKGGTLFLDEIGEAPADVQVLLLHVLEDKVVRRIGENENRPVDVRVIAASNRDLAADVSAGVFRQDLYYRLNVMTLTVPPLRDRTDDILLLAKHFLNHWNQKLGKKVAGFEAQVRQAFLKYEWPGNIRELDNVVYRSVALAEDGTYVGLEHLSDTGVGAGFGVLVRRVPQQSLKAEVAVYEKELIIAALEENKWNVKQTAEILNLSRVALGQKIKRHDLKRPEK